MLTYALEKSGDTSLYEQLYRHIKRDILSGDLTAGEKLPSKRALAAHLRLSVITVKNAYEQLVAEGYITGVEKRGYFVCDIDRPLTSAVTVPKMEIVEEKAWFMVMMHCCLHVNCSKKYMVHKYMKTLYVSIMWQKKYMLYILWNYIRVKIHLLKIIF